MRLASVRLNAGLEDLGERCFESSGLRGIVLPANVEYVWPGAFGACASLRCANFSAAHEITELGQFVFQDCERLERVLLNEGLEKVYLGCFSHAGFAEVVIPASVRHIDSWSFQGCRNLRKISFAGNALETIGELVFAGSGLEEFVAPASLFYIGKEAFAGCRSLRRVDLGACLRTGSTERYARWFLAERAFRDSGV